MERHVGIKIKELRIKNKDTLKSLAKKIDYDWSNLSKVERGIYSPSVDILKKIAQSYSVSPNYFFDEDGLTETEGKLVVEENLTPVDLKKKYNLVVDGNPATDEEIEQMIKYIQAYRIMKKMEGS